jgi:hypothetical protein
VDISAAFLPKDLLKNEIGFPCCISTAPMLLSLASVSNMKDLVKSGRAKTNAEQRGSLILLKVDSCSLVQENSPLSCQTRVDKFYHSP